MYCKYCGKEIYDDADICIHCGRSTGRQSEQNQIIEEPKTGIGVLLCLFLGLIGLVIGLLLYPANTMQRQTFLKGWGWTFLFSVVFVLVIYIAVVAAMI